MKVETIRRMRLAAVVLAVAAGAAGLAPSAEAQINCATLAHWSATAPPVNQIHVFCGEWDGANNRVKGFHSQPAGLTPAGITIVVQNAPNAQGVYNIQWEYTAHQGYQKFSTMFPNACTQNQVVTSIVYAANNPVVCPGGAPAWAQCGPSRPAVGPFANYCSGANNTALTIAFGLLQNGDVNTAFPL